MIFQLADVAMSARLFAAILSRIGRMRLVRASA
jgi:hypothetical protein